MPDERTANAMAALPVEFQGLKRVEMVEPPQSLLPAIDESIRNALAVVPKGRHVATVWVASEKGVNLAIVATKNTDAVDFSVLGYVGKTWDAPIGAGVVGMLAW